MSEKPVAFSELRIGDYFCDDHGMKFRKISIFEIMDQRFNTFNIQKNGLIYVDANESVIFIKYIPWRDDENPLEFSIEEAELEHRYDFFDSYLDIIETQLDSEEQYYSEMSDEVGHESSNFSEIANLMRMSFIVTLFSYLESWLNNHCSIRQQVDGFEVSIHDIQGKGIQRAKTYMTKVLGSSFPFNSSHLWEEIQWHAKLRNCIVHNNGVFSTESKLKDFIDKTENLSYQYIFNEYFIVVNKNFCRDALSILYSLLCSMIYYHQADKITPVQ